jgi:holo-[acyl-carrier protein] synthase
MRIVGIGLDLIDLPRFSLLYGGNDPELLARIYTAGEIAHIGDGQDQVARLAGRFAAKEAVLKVIGGLRDGIAQTDIEICSTPAGAPIVKLHGEAASEAQRLGIDAWFLSLTHSDNSAAAVAVGVGNGPT